MKVFFLKFCFILLFFFNFSSFSAFSQDIAEQKGTVLPETRIETVLDCQLLMLEVEKNMFSVKESVFENRGTYTFDGISDLSIDGGITSGDILGCGIKTGDISLWMIPFYIRYILEFVIGLAGLIAVAGIIYGGYLYLFAGFSDSKDKGKQAILYGVVGFVLTLIAWAIVNIMITLVSG